MKEKTKAYAAGIMDAEGCLSIDRYEDKNGYVHYNPVVRFTNTFEPLHKWWVEKFGGNVKQNEWENNSHKVYYQWKFGSDTHARKFLSEIQPYLILKHEESKVLMEYYGLEGKPNPSKREELYSKCSELKNRDSVTTNTPSFPDNNAYFAGFFDGEGSSYIVKFKQGYCSGFGYRSCVSIENSWKNIIDYMPNIFGGICRDKKPHNGTLPMYAWELRQQKDQKNFILSTLPYMIIKKEQSKLLLTFIDMQGKRNPIKRNEIYNDVRVLNGKMRESGLIGDNKSDLMVT